MKWQRIKALFLRHLISWPRNLEQITDIFWWPALEIIVWGFFTVYLNSQQADQPSVVTFLLGSIMFWAVVSISQQQASMVFMREAWDRNLLNLFSTPLTLWEFLTGGLLVALVKFTLGLFTMSALAYLLYAFNIFSLGWYFIPFLLSMSLFGWAANFFITGLILRFGFRVQSFAWSVLSVAQPFSAVFYPLSALPSWAQKIGLLFPTTYVFEGMRSVLLNGTMNQWYLIISFSLDAVYLILGLLFYRWMFKVAMEKGLLIKFV